MADKTVMIIDDDDDIRDSITYALEVEGYNVLRAENGCVGLSLLEDLPSENLPRCIILDMMMPELDGEGFIHEIARSTRADLRHVPIVLATARGQNEDTINIPSSILRIQKPFKLDQLYQTVEQFC